MQAYDRSMYNSFKQAIVLFSSFSSKDSAPLRVAIPIALIETPGYMLGLKPRMCTLALFSGEQAYSVKPPKSFSVR